MYQVGPVGFLLVVAALGYVLAAAWNGARAPGTGPGPALLLFAMFVYLLVLLAAGDEFYGSHGVVSGSSPARCWPTTSAARSRGSSAPLTHRLGVDRLQPLADARPGEAPLDDRAVARAHRAAQLRVAEQLAQRRRRARRCRLAAPCARRRPGTRCCRPPAAVATTGPGARHRLERRHPERLAVRRQAVDVARLHRRHHRGRARRGRAARPARAPAMSRTRRRTASRLGPAAGDPAGAPRAGSRAIRSNASSSTWMPLRTSRLARNRTSWPPWRRARAPRPGRRCRAAARARCARRPRRAPSPLAAGVDSSTRRRPAAAGARARPASRAARAALTCRVGAGPGGAQSGTYGPEHQRRLRVGQREAHAHVDGVELVDQVEGALARPGAGRARRRRRMIAGHSPGRLCPDGANVRPRECSAPRSTSPAATCISCPRARFP